MFHVIPISAGQADFCHAQFLTRYPRATEAAGDRVSRAARIIATGGVKLDDETPGVYMVRSDRDQHAYYTVDPARKSCTCPDANAGRLCKHRIAVGMVISLSQWIDEDIHSVSTASHLALSSSMIEQHERSLAYTYAAAAGNEPSRSVYCSLSYRGKPYKAEIVSLRRRSDTGDLLALVARTDEHNWYNDVATIEVRAFDCKDFYIQ